MIPEDEYPKLVRAVRISGTLWILSAGWSALAATLSLQRQGSAVENLMEGGQAALPAVTRFVLTWQQPMTGAVVGVAFLSLVLAWSFRRLSRIVLVIGVAAALLSCHNRLLEIGIRSALDSVFSNFRAS